MGCDGGSRQQQLPRVQAHGGRHAGLPARLPPCTHVVSVERGQPEIAHVDGICRPGKGRSPHSCLRRGTIKRSARCTHAPTSPARTQHRAVRVWPPGESVHIIKAAIGAIGSPAPLSTNQARGQPPIIWRCLQPPPAAGVPALRQGATRGGAGGRLRRQRLAASFGKAAQCARRSMPGALPHLLHQSCARRHRAARAERAASRRERGEQQQRSLQPGCVAAHATALVGADLSSGPGRAREEGHLSRTV